MNNNDQNINNNNLVQPNNNVPNNNNPNQNINNNNPAQQNNNGLQPVELHMIQVSNRDSNGSHISACGSIETNNSIEIWYALKTTMDYLRGCYKSKKTFKQELDPLVKQNLISISSYLKELNIDTKDIDGLAEAFGGIENRDENGKPVQICPNVDKNKISEIVNKYNEAQKQSIEDLVFNELTKKEIKIEGQENQKVLLAKHDFDDLKEEIKEAGGNNDIIDVALLRNRKVFLSKAAKEFQQEVKESKSVTQSNERDNQIEKYNKAVGELNKAIKSAIKQKIERYRNSSRNGYKKSQVPTILGALKLKKEEGNIVNEINQPVNKAMQQENIVGPGNAGDVNRVTELKSLADEFDVITGGNEDKLFSELSERIKEYWTKMDTDEDIMKYMTDILGQDLKVKGNMWDLLKNCFTERDQLNKADKKKIKYSGYKIENDNEDNKKDDGLINIANDTQIKEITLEYDEYDSLIAKRLFNSPSNIYGTMETFLKDVLLENPKDDNCKKAKGQLKGMVNKVLNEIKRYSEQRDADQDDVFVNMVLPLGSYKNGTKPDDKEHFVPTFIKKLFDVKSGESLDNLANNLTELYQDESFKTFLSKIMESKLAVGMIENNFKEIEKDFKRAGKKATRRGKFKEEFWDNNLKGHLPIFGNWSNGRWKKNLIKLAGESLGGFAFGSVLAGVAGVGFTAGFWSAVAAAAIIVVTAIAIAALVSLIMTLVKGFRDLKNNDGFYKPSKADQNNTKTSQTAYLNRIYTAFLTFGADEEKLKQLVKDSQNPNKSQLNKFEKSSRGKFFKSMMKMKDFLKEHATGDLQKSLKASKPFQILEKRNQEPPQNEQNNENINI